MSTIEERLYKAVMAADAKDVLDAQPANNPTVLRYYYYETSIAANDINQIDYDRVFEVVSKANDPSAIKNVISRLEKSLTGGDKGDNFGWTNLVVKADNYNGRTVVYRCGLRRDGQQVINANRKAISEDGANINLDDFENKFNLFVSQFGGKYVNVQFGPNDYFVEGEPEEEHLKMLLKADINYNRKNKPGQSGVQKTSQEFMRDLSNLRLFLIPQNQLASPDYQLAQTDEFAGIPGQLEKLKQIADKRLKELGSEQPEEESLGEKMKTDKPNKPKEPMTTEKSKDKYVQASVDDYTHEYTGGFDIMQRLVRDQHKKMKVRKEAQDTSKQMHQKAKKYEEIAKVLKDTSQKLQQVEKTVEQTESAYSPNKYASMTQRVLKKYMQEL